LSARVFIWVQHLLGLGHFARARAIAEALRDDGFDVTLVSGGITPEALRPSGISFVQLPPARAEDEMFDALVDHAGVRVTEAWHARRQELLLAAFDEAAPDVLITETYPFGRRLLEPELLALIARAVSAPRRPKIVSSVRDILQRPRKTLRAEAMVAQASDIYDAVLVHGDPRIIQLPESFAETSSIEKLCRYTGYVCKKIPVPSGAREGVLVSAGGGAAAGALIDVALQARALSRLRHERWTIVTGPLTAESTRGVPDGVSLVQSLPDFTERLSHAVLSISQAGYNTVVETVAAGTPSIVVPFETDREKEQVTRARVFAAHGMVQMIRPCDLDVERLVRAIDLSEERPFGSPVPDVNGGAGTVKALRDLLS